MDLLERVRTSKMSRFQLQVIVTCFLINVVEGIDVFMMSFLMPSLSADWSLSPVEIGYLLSAALIGMTIGSFTLSPLGDRIGRRNLILGCLLIVAVGMGLSFVATNLTQLIILRALTGLGVGATMSSVSVLVSEYSSEKHSGLAMGLFTTGYPLGGLIAGASIGALVGTWGWRPAFLAGAIVTVIVGVIAIYTLAESIDFLTVKQPPNALNRVNLILGKMDLPLLSELPQRPNNSAPKFNEVLREIFGPRMLAITIFMWIAYGLLQSAFYFTTSWTPQAFTMVTGDQQLGVTAGSMVSLGGILGSVVFAVLSIWVSKRILTVVFLGIAAILYIGFSNSLGTVTLALVLAVCLGLINNSAIAGFYTLGPRIYSPIARSTGFGWMLGAGRIASFISPIVVGYLIDANWSIPSIFSIFAFPLILSGALLLLVGLLQRRQKTNEPEEVLAVQGHSL